MSFYLYFLGVVIRIVGTRVDLLLSAQPLRS